MDFIPHFPIFPIQFVEHFTAFDDYSTMAAVDYTRCNMVFSTLSTPVSTNPVENPVESVEKSRV